MTTLPSRVPVYGTNYAIGFIGFKYDHDDFISIGIRWFERWDTHTGEAPSHTFVVSGPNECIEAQARGVVCSDLAKYFNDPHCVVWFRKPTGLNDVMAMEIIQGAESELGKRYAFTIIVADLLANTFIGHWIDMLTRGLWKRWLTKILLKKDEDVCSMVSAKALNNTFLLKGHGILALPAREITPADLDGDTCIFEPRSAIV